MKRHLLCLMVLISCFGVLLHAQQGRTLRGRVVDENGAPMPGVTVMVKGTLNGAATDTDGRYVISAKITDALIFSCLGYEDAEIRVGDRQEIDVTLVESAQQLEAASVVSMGYGNALRRDLTGSVTKVNVTDILKTDVVTMDQALAGRIAGVVVTTGDGSSGEDAEIVIRGNNSISQSNQPLFVLDGFQTEENILSSIDPKDVESIQVLKDASSTAIYGARGANGVIVITTKSGKAGKPVISLSASCTVNTMANKVELLEPYDYLTLQQELSPGTLDKTYFSGGRDLEWYKDKEAIDWQDNISRVAVGQKYSVGIRGGSPKGSPNATAYNVTFSAIDQDHIIVDTNYQRYQGRINFNQNIGERFTVGVNVMYAHKANTGVNVSTGNAGLSTSYLMYSVYGYRPIGYKEDNSDLLMNALDEDATSTLDLRFNPALSVRNEHRKTINNTLQANAYMKYEITRNLELKVSGGYGLNRTRREAFNGSNTSTGYSKSPSSKGINGEIYWTDKSDWLAEATLTWTRKFRNHNIRLLGGMTFSGIRYTYDGIKSYNMLTEALGVQALYTGDLQPITSNYYDSRQLSFFGRTEYNYKRRYYVNVTMRADGSSKFPVHNRWGYFPSVGLSWNFNKETWLKSASWLSTGKLRASWGLTGNNRTTSPYDYYASVGTSSNQAGSSDYVMNNTIVTGYYVGRMTNENLKWETTEQYNIGLDLGFLKERIRFEGDIYLKNTRDLLLAATMPGSTGYSTAMMNVGSIRNKGLELTLETVNINKKMFGWTSSFNIAFNRNTVLSLNHGQNSLLSTVSWNTAYSGSNAYISQVGKPIGMMYGYIYEGTYKYEDFDQVAGGWLLKEGIPYHSTLTRDVVHPGDPKYRDMNLDGVISDADNTVIGCGQPVHTGGFTNNFRIGSFDVNIFFNWSYGNDVLNANRLIFEQCKGTNLNQFATYKDRWTADNPESDIPRAGASAISYYSSRVVEDASYLRLRNVSVGYTLPAKLAKKIHMSSLRISLNATNLFTITRYSGPDPEVSTRRSSALTPGFDYSACPRSRGGMIGLELTF